MLNWKYKNEPNKIYSDYEKKKIDVIIEKNRHGETGKIQLLFEYELTAFENMVKGG